VNSFEKQKIPEIRDIQPGGTADYLQVGPSSEPSELLRGSTNGGAKGDRANGEAAVGTKESWGKCFRRMVGAVKEKTDVRPLEVGGGIWCTGI